MSVQILSDDPIRKSYYIQFS